MLHLHQHKTQWIFLTAIQTAFLPLSPSLVELTNTEGTAYLAKKKKKVILYTSNVI